ncbi:MAG: OmpA family protein [Oxalobacter sp.]|nr:OmpA family protein [Oxalobacter sp.]
MLRRSGDNRKSTNEPEKPFWISYADLMTALMFLFLAIMVVSIMSISHEINLATAGEKGRSEAIGMLCENIKKEAESINGNIHVNCKNNNIHFGSVGTFDQNSYALSDEGQKALNDVIPIILKVSESEEGKRWFKQIVIEGFTDTDGSYLYNLDLSVKRSEYVMCSLLDPKIGAKDKLTAEQRRLIKELFLAGGVSFNSAKESKQASRRVELRLQFFGLKDNPNRLAHEKFALDEVEKCPLH